MVRSRNGISDSVAGIADAATGPMTRAAFLSGAARGAVALAACLAPFASHTGFAAAAAPLATRPIHKSKNGERLPVIGLGTAQDFGDHSDAASMSAKSQVVKDLIGGGGKVLDTAASYSNAEEICGEFMERLGLRDKTFVATKFGERGKDNGIASIERSMKLLRANVIDLMFVHNMIDTDTHLPTLRDYKDKGRIRYFGVTSTGPNQDQLTKWMDQIDFVEFAYSVDLREPEKVLLPTAQDKGVAVFVALPFGRNRLLNKMRGKEVPAWAREELNCQSFAQLALKFIVSHPAVTVAIPGTENPKHMIENLDAGRGVIADAKQREKIAALWDNA